MCQYLCMRACERERAPTMRNPALLPLLLLLLLTAGCYCSLVVNTGQEKLPGKGGAARASKAAKPAEAAQAARQPGANTQTSRRPDRKRAQIATKIRQVSMLPE